MGGLWVLSVRHLVWLCIWIIAFYKSALAWSKSGSRCPTTSQTHRLARHIPPVATDHYAISLSQIHRGQLFRSRHLHRAPRLRCCSSRLNERYISVSKTLAARFDSQKTTCTSRHLCTLPTRMRDVAGGDCFVVRSSTFPAAGLVGTCLGIGY